MLKLWKKLKTKIAQFIYYMIRKFRAIVQSKKAPEDHDVLWLNCYHNGEWVPIGGIGGGSGISSAELKALQEALEEHINEFTEFTTVNSSENIIDNWKDAKDFLAGFTQEKTLRQILDELKIELPDKPLQSHPAYFGVGFTVPGESIPNERIQEFVNYEIGSPLEVTRTFSTAGMEYIWFAHHKTNNSLKAILCNGINVITSFTIGELTINDEPYQVYLMSKPGIIDNVTLTFE